MLQLASKTIATFATQHLAETQQAIDDKVTFTEKVAIAQKLWDNKKSKIEKKRVFSEIETVLKDMCVSMEICNYCEQNEASDIEHIYPKSFFPQKTFIWDNYLLACKTCNTGHKLDKFYIFHPSKTNLHFLVRGTEPANEVGAFINPRVEDPNSFMMLDLASCKFYPTSDLNTVDYHKADRTIEILKLNDRDELIETRKRYIQSYFDRLNQVVEIHESSSFKQLNELRPIGEYVNESDNLQKEEIRLINGLKSDIQSMAHPSVWYAIKSQIGVLNSNIHKRFLDLFKRFPEAKTW